MWYLYINHVTYFIGCKVIVTLGYYTLGFSLVFLEHNNYEISNWVTSKVESVPKKNDIRLKTKKKDLV